jgi:two-component system OmpR family sensor kinase
LRVEEKSILAKFVCLYLISTFILLSVIAYLIYDMQYKSIYNLSISHLETISSKISSKIITSDMKNEKLDFESLCSSDQGIKFVLFDENNNKIFTDLTKDVSIQFSKRNYLNDQHIVTVDKSTLGHLGVNSVVMVNDTFQEKIDTVTLKLLVAFVTSYLVICAVGYYLIQLFMRPIQNERKRLDNFIKDTTHELNTPITALMICTDKQTPRSEKNMERIYLSSKRISQIYKDLTHLILENNKKKKIQNLCLNTIITKELEYFDLLASKKNITTNFLSDKTCINIDPEDFNRIIGNVLSNAIKYNKRGGEIIVTLKNNKLSIADNGIGIDKKDQINIFNRYYRATTQDGGFGLGLNIVDKICKEYNIKIEVISKIKQGTTFSFDFTNLV